MKEITDIKLYEVSLIPDGTHDIGFIYGYPVELMNAGEPIAPVPPGASPLFHAAKVIECAMIAHQLHKKLK